MSEATMTSKGQITIPADIRKALGLQAGERVVFTRLIDGTTVLRAKTRSIMDLQGMLKGAAQDRPKVAIEDMQIGGDSPDHGADQAMELASDQIHESAGVYRKAKGSKR
jgi:antitoxin PrlF